MSCGGRKFLCLNQLEGEGAVGTMSIFYVLLLCAYANILLLCPSL